MWITCTDQHTSVNGTKRNKINPLRPIVLRDISLAFEVDIIGAIASFDWTKYITLICSLIIFTHTFDKIE